MNNVVPNEWEIVPLGELCLGVRGVSYKPDDLSTVKTKQTVTLLRSNNIQSGQLLLANVKNVNQKKVSEKQLARKGDIAVCMSNGSKRLVGKSAVFRSIPHGTKFTIGAFCSIFRPLEFVSSGFVAQLLSSEQFQHQVDSSLAGSAINNLKNSDVIEYQFLKPPLPEQKKIAAILSSVDEVIEKTRSQVDKLKDLKTGMMQELLTKGIGQGGVPHTEFKDSPVGKIPVGWESYLLGDVFDLKNGVNKDKNAFGHGVPIISYKNVYVGGGILDSDLSALVEMNEKELSRFRVHFGDVFFTRTSETPDEIGFTNVYLGKRDDVVFNGFVIRGRQKNNLFHPHFLKYIFQSNAVRKQMMDNSKFTTRAGISGESLGRIEISVPDISEQKNIANALDSVEARIIKTINKINAIQSFKKAMMQDLLTGKVRVNVDTRELADA